MLSSPGKSPQYLRSARSRPVWLILFGLALAIATAIAWRCWPRLYFAEAHVRIAPPLQLDDPAIVSDDRAYRNWKVHLVEAVTSPSLLRRALQRTGIARPAYVQRQPDETAWLSQSLEPTIADDSDVMRIRIRSHNPEMNFERIILDCVAQALVDTALMEDRIRISNYRDQVKSAYLQKKEVLEEKTAERNALTSEMDDPMQRQQLAEIDAEIAKLEASVNEKARKLVELNVNPYTRHDPEIPARIVQRAMNVDD